MRGLLFSFLSVTVFTASVSADMRAMRNDPVVPNRCSMPSADVFKSNTVQKITYSTLGGKRRGFTHEYPIFRSDARILWQVAKRGRADQATLRRLRANEQLWNAYQDIIDAQRTYEFDFDKEGDVLEALSLMEVTRQMNENNYFLTGGIEYYHERQGRTLGEIDLWLARRSDCTVVAIGEMKLNPRRVSKANKQLERFQNYIWRNQNRDNSARSRFVNIVDSVDRLFGR